MNGTNRLYVVLASLALLAAGTGIGFWWASHSAGPHEAAPAPESTASGERQVLYWFDPMKPDQHFDKPGKSPFMDMQLVPRYADEAREEGIGIASSARQNLGIRTVEVERGSIAGSISVPGTIGWDLRREHVVSARVDAVVDRLLVKAPYESVRAGQPLAAILAPTWSAAMAEAGALGQASSSDARGLQSAAQARLRVLGVPPGSVLRDGRIVLVSPVRGVVSEIGARDGIAVPAGTLLFRVNGTETVWLEAAIPQAGVGAIAPGTPIQAQVSAMPGQVFRGRVEALLPQIDSGNRTQQARIVLDNPDGLLVPGMFAQISLDPVAGAEHALVPSDAVIGSGDDARVIVLGQGGTFRPVAVRTGQSGGGKTEIIAGLKGGERVVASGQFLIDSEASLSGALDRLGDAPGDGIVDDAAQSPVDVSPPAVPDAEDPEPAR